MSQFPDNGEFEVNVLYMEVTMVNGYHYAYNTISLTLKLT